MTTKLSELGDTQDVEWLNPATATGGLRAPNGAVGTPAYSFANDLDCGLYRIGANNIGFAVQGFRAWDVSSSQMSFNVGISAAGVSITGDRNSVTASTSDDALNTTSQLGTTRTNTGAAGEVIITLPSAATGYNYRFVVTEAQYLRIKAAGSDTIRNAGTVSAAAGYIRANTIGNALRIECAKSGEWYVTSIIGTWTIDS